MLTRMHGESTRRTRSSRLSGGPRTARIGAGTDSRTSSRACGMAGEQARRPRGGQRNTPPGTRTRGRAGISSCDACDPSREMNHETNASKQWQGKKGRMGRRSGDGDLKSEEMVFSRCSIYFPVRSFVRSFVCLFKQYYVQSMCLCFRFVCSYQQ